MLQHKQTPLILASTSPRRKQLLARAGYKFDVVAPEIDETAFSAENYSPKEFAEQIALAKAKSVAVRYKDRIVIGADTVVDFDGQIIGKASDQKHAEQIVKKLFSRAHKVITALAIVRLCDGIEIVESDTTVVHPRKMSDEQIAEHIRGGSWRDKAGAYAIQETGDDFVEKIDGSLTNVMGMPMGLLERLLKQISD